MQSEGIKAIVIIGVNDSLLSITAPSKTVN